VLSQQRPQFGQSWAIEVFAVEVFAVEVFAIEVFAVEVFAVEVFAVEVFAVEVFSFKCSVSSVQFQVFSVQLGRRVVLIQEQTDGRQLWI